MKLNQLNHKKKGIKLSLILGKLEEGLTQRQIAKELGCSEANISKRLKVAKRKGTIYFQCNSGRNFWRFNEEYLTKTIGDDVVVPKDGLLRLHQFDVKYSLWHPRYIKTLENFFKGCVSKRIGKKWNPRPNSKQTFYSVPITSKYFGKVTLRWCQGSESLTVQGIESYGKHYFEARDRALLLSFRIIRKLEEDLGIRFREGNFVVSRSGDFALDPPEKSELKTLVKGISEAGVVKIGNVWIDNSNKNRGHVEVKTDHKEESERLQAIKNANNLARLVYIADDIATKQDIQLVLNKIDYILESIKKPNSVVRRRVFIEETEAPLGNNWKQFDKNRPQLDKDYH